MNSLMPNYCQGNVNYLENKLQSVESAIQSSDPEKAQKKLIKLLEKIQHARELPTKYTMFNPEFEGKINKIEKRSIELCRNIEVLFERKEISGIVNNLENKLQSVESAIQSSDPEKAQKKINKLILQTKSAFNSPLKDSTLNREFKGKILQIEEKCSERSEEIRTLFKNKEKEKISDLYLKAEELCDKVLPNEDPQHKQNKMDALNSLMECLELLENKPLLKYEYENKIKSLVRSTENGIFLDDDQIELTNKVYKKVSGEKLIY